MNLMDLFIKLGVKDEASDKLDKVKESVGKGLATAAKVGAAAVAATGTAVAGIAKEAINQYAEYEQLVGGVETLFGDSANKVVKYANEAYSSAGMSANEYMATVTGFSASLLQGLGGNTELASDIANRAITDMSDNANKMGTSMESIQNAYQGFAKQNYTMLDNLKLGYGGTKEEMQRLIVEASKMTDEMSALGVTVDANSMSFDNIINAISVVQEHLGITGTTAEEASKTIQGSVSAMKASWQNLLTGLTGGTNEFKQNTSQLIDNFVQSVSTVWDNIEPQITKALNGIAKLVTTLAPKISEILPDMITSLLPALIVGITSLITALADTIPTIIETISTLAPAMIQAGLTILGALGSGLLENIDLVIDTAIEIIDFLIQGFIEALPTIIEAMPQIISAIVRGLLMLTAEVFTAGFEIVGSLLDGIGSMIGNVWQKAKELGQAILEPVKEVINDARTWGSDLISNFVDGIVRMWNNLISTLRNVAQTVRDFLGFSEPKKGPLSNFHTYAPDMMELFAKGIADNEDVVKDQIAKSFDFKANMAVSGEKSADNISSGSASSDSITIVVQSVLDGKVIGETAYKWNKNHSKAMGIA